jgi:hypothetical protein
MYSIPCPRLVGKWAYVWEVELHSLLILNGIHRQLLDTSPTNPKGNSTSWYLLTMMLATPVLVLMLWRRELSLDSWREWNNSLVVQHEAWSLDLKCCPALVNNTLIMRHTSDTWIPLYLMTEGVQSVLSTFASNSWCTLWLDFRCFLFWNGLSLQTRKVTMVHFWDIT